MTIRPILGLAWFDKKDWEEWRKISEDQIEEKFEDWLADAETTKSTFEEEGYIVKDVVIRPNEFKKWCKKNKKKLDSTSRSHYVTELLQNGKI